MDNLRYKVQKDNNFSELGFSVLRRKANFGDLLLREAADQIFDLPRIRQDFAGAIFGGSVVSENYMRMSNSLPGDGKVLMHACGVRSEDFDAELVSNRVLLAGVRGPISNQSTGVSAVGDPGLLSPLALGIWPTITSGGKHLLVPHYKDVNARPEIGVELRTVHVKRGRSSKELIAEIAQADFVLAGAMHAGIIAYALGTPFSFYKYEYLDVPIKYQDFANFYGIPYQFATSLKDATNFYLENRSAYDEIDPNSILCLLDPVSKYLHPDISSIVDQLSDFLEIRKSVHAVKARRLSNLNH